MGLTIPSEKIKQIVDEVQSGKSQIIRPSAVSRQAPAISHRTALTSHHPSNKKRAHSTKKIAQPQGDLESETVTPDQVVIDGGDRPEEVDDQFAEPTTGENGDRSGDTMDASRDCFFENWEDAEETDVLKFSLPPTVTQNPGKVNVPTLQPGKTIVVTWKNEGAYLCSVLNANAKKAKISPPYWVRSVDGRFKGIYRNP